MTEHLLINKGKSPKYKAGYTNGLILGSFAGLVAATIVGTIAMTNCSYSVKHGSSNKNSAGIEQEIGSEKADEMIDFTRFIMFDADEDTIKQYKKECMGSYSVDKEKCMTMHPIEIANCKRQSEDLDAKLKQMKCEDGVVNDCMEPYYKKHDDCKEVIFEKAYKRFKEQRNIPKRR